MVQVTTKDGYILGMQRIPMGRTSKMANRPPVLLQHGILMVRSLDPLHHIFELCFFLYVCSWGILIYSWKNITSMN